MQIEEKRSSGNEQDTTFSSTSVVIPVFNSEQSLPLLIERLQPVLEELKTSFELILVNDASRDQSWDLIESLVENHSWIQGISLMRNYGQHNALLCGIRAANHEIIITLDDDLQHPPEEIPKLLNKLLLEKLDVVYGTPENERHGLFRDMASVITKWALQNAMGADIAQKVSAFRVFRTRIRDAFTNYSGPFVSIDVLLTWGTTKFSAIPVRHEARQLGTSNYTFRKLARHALNMITGFTTLPLRMATFLGFGFSVFGLCILLYVLINYLIRGSAVPGFAFLASSIALFSGVQLFALGIIGEYFARMHFRLMDRPAYIVRESYKKTNCE